MPTTRRDQAFLPIVRDATLIVVGASLVGFAVNGVRPSGAIPFVQRTPYDIVVPCPEHVGEARAMTPDDPRLLDRHALIIDARARADYDVAHVAQAINKPFDWLGPPVEGEVNQLSKQVAASEARFVIVYGDGEDPDSGREWARLLAGGGIKNVYYVTGGAPALGAKLSARATPPASEGGNP